MNSLEEIAQEIKENNNYLLVGHSIPDGDCVGSLIALYLALLYLDKEATILLADPVPEIYNYLVGGEVFQLPEHFKGTTSNVIFLDCSDDQRPGPEVTSLIKDRVFTINIDHHPSNTLFGDLNYIDSHAAATAEIIYELLKILQVDLTPDIANALYVAILQDTGSFQHSSTTSTTLRIAADLLEHGVNLEKTRINLFQSKNPRELALLGQALTHMNFNENGKLAWMTLAYNDVKAIDATDIHPEGIINHTLMVKGVEVGLLFRQIALERVKIGFRSKGQVDVNLLAGKLGGGGHRQAAGAEQEGELEEIIKRTLAEVEDVLG